MDYFSTKGKSNEWGLESKMLYQAVLVKALDILSEKEQTEFDLLLNENDTTTKEVLAFLQSKIPTFEQLVTEERDNIKQNTQVAVS
jgi:hypothetical protein